MECLVYGRNRNRPGFDFLIVLGASFTACLMLAQRCRRWPNINQESVQHLVFADVETMLAQRCRRWPNIKQTLCLQGAMVYKKAGPSVVLDTQLTHYIHSVQINIYIYYIYNILYILYYIYIIYYI